MKIRNSIWIMAIALFSASCSSSPYRHTLDNEKIENKNILFLAPDSAWEIVKSYNLNDYKTSSKIPALRKTAKGAHFNVHVYTWPFAVVPYAAYFDKEATYDTILKDEDMQLDNRDKEQGIGYKRLWIVYANGMKCLGGVFSRNHGGTPADVAIKDYSINCGYYDIQEGKQILIIDYRYNYAGGNIRLQQDKNTPQSELLTRDQAELQLKQAVKKLVSTLQIKNLDRERMEREGLMHYDKQYEISPY